MVENRTLKRVLVRKDVVVVGAGTAGLCAALASSRLGRKTALVTDRPVLGGNASSEIRVTVSGAEYSPFNRFARETGLLEEMFLRLNARAAAGKWHWIYLDEIYFALTAAEPNLEVFLNTTVHRVNCRRPGRIDSVEGIQLRAEKRLEFAAKFFVDASGDSTVGFLAGADYRVGRESRREFNEQYAPAKADRKTMGATLLFSSCDRGKPIKFTPPAWAIDVRKIPAFANKPIGRQFYRQPDGTFYPLWWAEYGGELDSIHDDDRVVWHTRQLVYGFWDYIKNSGYFSKVANLELNWVGILPGKRESRRLMGPYIVTGKDLERQKNMTDAIGFCGWPIDIHPPKGYAATEPANKYDFLPGITDIPLRCLFSRNIENLFFAGRNVSCSHVGLGSLRVQATTAVMGQAAGTAAAFCLDNKLKPAEIFPERIDRLQEILSRSDQSITGYRLLEKNDLSRTARVVVSSVRKMEIVESKKDKWHSLDSRIGLILPVKTAVLKSVFLCLNGPAGQEIRADVFGCDRPENYRFQNRLKVIRKKLLKEGWISLELNVKPDKGQKVLIVLEKTPGIRVRCSEFGMTGVQGFNFDVEFESSLKSNDDIGFNTMFRPVASVPCFRIEPVQAVFDAASLNDGYIRPYGLPHLFSSGKIRPGKPEFVVLKLTGTARVRSVELVFNSGLNTNYYASSGPRRNLVRDYRILVKAGNREQTIVTERDNILRFRRHNFSPVRAGEIKLVIDRTWGTEYAEIFDFRVYE